MPSKKGEKSKLRVTTGIVDYASHYSHVLNNQKKIIDSARYFISMRRAHMTEVLKQWAIYDEDLPYEEARIILNEFLSPKCTLLQFEYNNHTEKGRANPITDNQARDLARINEIWQKHILGQVITKQSLSNTPGCLVEPVGDIDPAQAEPLFGVDSSAVQVESVSNSCSEVNFADAISSISSLQKERVLVLDVYEKSKWFIDNVNVDTLKATNEQKDECRTAIEAFKNAYSLTWRTIQVLCYLEILESHKKIKEQKIADIFEKCCYMLHKNVTSSKEIEQLEKCAHLFIQKYKKNDDEPSLIRCGFEYLDQKMKSVQSTPGYETIFPYVIDVTTSLNTEEMKMSEAYVLFDSLHDFTDFKKN